MTKEQLIELIQKTVPDGDLINLRIGKDEVFEINGIDDDSEMGLWNLLLRRLDKTEIPFQSAIENSYLWKNSGLESKINWKL